MKPLLATAPDEQRLSPKGRERPYDVIAARLLERYGDVVTHCEFSVALGDEGDRSALAGMIADLHAHADTVAGDSTAC